MIIAIPRKILIVTPNWIGDVLFTFPFLAALREAYPAAKIICWTTPRCVEVLRNQPLIDDLLVYDERKTRGIFSKLEFVTRLRAKKFDAAFLLHRSMTRLLLCALAGIPTRIGYANRKQRWLLTDPLWPNNRGQVLKFDFGLNKKVKFQDLTPRSRDRASGKRKPAQEWIGHGKHKVEYFLDLARFAGIPVHHPWYQFHQAQEKTKWVQERLAAMGLKDHPFAVVHPGANWTLKRWPVSHYSMLAGRLAAEGMAVVITGSGSDQDLAEQVKGNGNPDLFSFCGVSDLEGLAALFARASVVVANDTGPMHLASAVGTPVVALFGPTQPHLTGPYGRGPVRILRKEVGCNEDPCYNLRCKENVCMRAISVEEVWEAAKELFASSPVSQFISTGKPANRQTGKLI